MQNRVPVAREARPPLPEFVPVPRKYRHDGWTPERQKAFIEALADTGSVSRAAAMVNMAQANCYTLRRAPGAEGFRRAWDAALDFGLKRLKDIAFERAIEGQLVPVFVAGKLMGFRRKRNDALLIFCLRHYGQDANGKPTTINYFQANASAGVAGDRAAAASANVQTVTRAGCAGDMAVLRDDRSAAALQRFAGVTLDPEAHAAIAAALEACAARTRELETAAVRGGADAEDLAADDPNEHFVRTGPNGSPYRGELEPSMVLEDVTLFGGDEGHWSSAGAPLPDWAQTLADGTDATREAASEEAVATVKPRRGGRRKAE